MRITDDLSSLRSVPANSNAPSFPHRKTPRGNKLASPFHISTTWDSEKESGISLYPRKCDMNAPNICEQYQLFPCVHNTIGIIHLTTLFPDGDNFNLILTHLPSYNTHGASPPFSIHLVISLAGSTLPIHFDLLLKNSKASFIMLSMIKFKVELPI
jgi:hypothetical protein